MYIYAFLLAGHVGHVIGDTLKEGDFVWHFFASRVNTFILIFFKTTLSGMYPNNSADHSFVHTMSQSISSSWTNTGKVLRCKDFIKEQASQTKTCMVTELHCGIK